MARQPAAPPANCVKGFELVKWASGLRQGRRGHTAPVPEPTPRCNATAPSTYETRDILRLFHRP